MRETDEMGGDILTSRLPPSLFAFVLIDCLKYAADGDHTDLG